MLLVYAIPVSLYCAKLRILLRHKGLDWREEPPPGGYGSDEYRKLVPAGNLPALRDGELLLADSEAIGEYLNDKYPSPPMLPDDPSARAKVREFSRYHDTRLEPAVRALFPLIDRKSRGDVSRLWDHIGAKLEDGVRLVPQNPRELTLADCGYPITLNWISALGEHFERPAHIPDAFHTYLEHITTHRAVKDELAEYRPRLQSWLGQQ